MLALTVALLAQSIGFTTGFDPVTFRVIQLAAQLVAPVVLAWGLVELVARGPAVRFGARLVAAALIVVIGVVLATDPLAASPFGIAWPSAAVHYQLIPHYALIALHLTVAVATVAAVALCAARGRGQAAQGRLVTGAAAVGAAVLSAVALRFTLPAGAAYPALSVLSAVLVWFGMTRVDAMVPGDSRAGLNTPGAPGAEPVTGAIERPGTRLSRSPAPGEGPGGPAIPGTDILRPAPRPHGLIAIYTLLEDKVAAFDRMTEEAAEQVRAQEPDTLVYVIHTVPKAPMQRIFYEIYRDQAAYERHEQQPYIKRFVTARRPHVLATNVIELRLKYAKISPLVQDETQAATSVGALPRSGGQAPGPWTPAPGYGGI